MWLKWKSKLLHLWATNKSLQRLRSRLRKMLKTDFSAISIQVANTQLNAKPENCCFCLISNSRHTRFTISITPKGHKMIDWTYNKHIYKENFPQKSRRRFRQNGIWIGSFRNFCAWKSTNQNKNSSFSHFGLPRFQKKKTTKDNTQNKIHLKSRASDPTLHTWKEGFEAVVI